MKEIVCIVGVIKLPIKHWAFEKRRQSHIAKYGDRATTRPGGRETFLCIRKP